VNRAPGTGINSPRENLNGQTFWIDMSHVYGVDSRITEALRSHIDGKLKVGGVNGKELPINPKTGAFLSGDWRANQDILLQAYHVLFMLEHNRLCDLLKRHYKHGLSDGME
jgi:peroxidase